MAKWLIPILLGVICAAGYTKATAQSSIVGPPAPGPRFWMSDYTDVGGDDHYHVWMLHDNKFREVCFLMVSTANGDSRSITMTPRQC